MPVVLMEAIDYGEARMLPSDVVAARGRDRQAGCDPLIIQTDPRR